jgi:crotonobetainyl-CoA:carnitine CoA-transferase CaiB-like acyl-CoA transferase
MEHYEKEGKNIVYLDESGFEKETLRAYGYAIEAHAVWMRLIGKPRDEPMSLGLFFAGFYWASVFLISMSMRMFFMARLFSAYCPPCR